MHAWAHKKRTDWMPNSIWIFEKKRRAWEHRVSSGRFYRKVGRDRKPKIPIDLTWNSENLRFVVAPYFTVKSSSLSFFFENLLFKKHSQWPGLSKTQYFQVNLDRKLYFYLKLERSESLCKLSKLNYRN